MVIQVLSDLHFEFMADKGKSFVKNMDMSGVDVLVVAGDLAPAKYLENSLKLLCDKYPEVVFVSGNHELYRSSPKEVDRIRVKCSNEISNLHWLENSCWTYAKDTRDIRFVGSTLWFQDDPLAVRYRRNMTDFDMIEDFIPWVFERNRESIAFLEETICQEDIVVTHYLPSQRSVDPKYEGSTLNSFFVCDIEETLRACSPKLLIHGHTHEPCDYMLGSTQVVCNPHGYINIESQRGFNSKLTIDV